MSTAMDPAEAPTPTAQVGQLLAQLTLDEKVRQLQSFHQNGVPRLGIPHLPVGEVLHGLMGERATSFPQAIALGSTWDPELVERVGTAIAREARAAGILQAFAPMLGLAQDPRWGRVEESFGEDPVLVSALGVAYIHGMQGRGAARFDRDHLIATAKHFAADGLPLAGQNGGAMEISEGALRETHLLPFEAAVKEARVGAIMPAHHALNGVPCHANTWLLETLLRQEWGFDGFIVSDFGDLYLLADVPVVNAQRVAASLGEAARLALQSGVDMELAPGPWAAPRRVFAKNLHDEITAGRIPLALLDRAVAHVLRIKLAVSVDPAKAGVAGVDATAALIEAGGEEDGAGDLWGKLVRDGELNVPSESRRPDWQAVLNDPAHDELALETARQAVVLLKNEGGLLPLAPERCRRIAMVGPLASDVNLGGYSTHRPKFYVSPLAGVTRRFAGADVTYAPGCTLADDSADLLPAAVAAAQAADVVIAVVGTTRKEMGENLDRDSLDLVGGQQQLVEAVAATGTPVVLILLNGGPLSLRWAAANVPAILEGWYLGQATGTALAEVLAGDCNPGGKLPVTIPVNVGRAPCHYNRPPAARKMNYHKSPDAPLFPFGHGLSYTQFSYGQLEVAPATLAADETATVRLTVTNTGDRSGDEVVQLYVRDDVSSRVRPALELKGFQRIPLAPGESREVSFPVGPAQLRFWHEGGWVVEPGSFTLMVGASCADIRLQGTLIVS